MLSLWSFSNITYLQYIYNLDLSILKWNWKKKIVF